MHRDLSGSVTAPAAMHIQTRIHRLLCTALQTQAAMTRSVLGRRFLPAAITLCMVTAAASAQPFIPKDDTHVLERLPYRAGNPEVRALRSLQEALRREPSRLDLAVRLAQRYMAIGRSESDPRYAGYAEAVLGRWWALPEPPTEVLVLRATLNQNRHRFGLALDDLDRALKRDPRHYRAWLTRAVILTVTGHYAEAKQSCMPLVRLADALIAATCISNVATVTGRAEAGHALLDRALAASSGSSLNVRIWALTSLAETAARLGRSQQSEHRFIEALALLRSAGQRDPYLLAAYADFLLDQRRHAEVIELLQGETRIDSLLLRLTLAERGVGSSRLATHFATLKARFRAARARGEALHQGEEARFTLELLNDPRSALELAQGNWAIQREPRDARILLESAAAALAPHAASPVFAWLERTRLQDSTLTQLAARVEALE